MPILKRFVPSFIFMRKRDTSPRANMPASLPRFVRSRPSLLSDIFRLLQFRNIYQSLPILVVLAPFAIGLLPSTMENRLHVGSGSFSVTIIELFCILSLPIFFFQRYTCVPLLLMAIFLSGFGLFSSLYSNIPEHAVSFSMLLSWVLLASSKIRWTLNDICYLGLVTIPILGILLLEVVYFGLGFGSYTAATGNVVGTSGEASRIGTTYGAATGSAVIVYFLTVFAIYSTYCYKRNRMLSLFMLSMGIIATLLLFSRGGLLMILTFCGLLFFVRNKPFVRHMGLRVLIIIAGVAILYGAFFSKSEFTNLLLQRGPHSQFLDGSGRIMRYREAINYGMNNSMGSGINNYYFRKGWISRPMGLPEGNTSPHNVYLLFFAELGLFGALIIVVFNASLLITCFVRKNYYLLISIIPIIFIGQNIELTYWEPPTIYLWAILASLCFTSRFDEGKSTGLIERQQ